MFYYIWYYSFFKIRLFFLGKNKNLEELFLNILFYIDKESIESTKAILNIKKDFQMKELSLYFSIHDFSFIFFKKSKEDQENLINKIFPILIDAVYRADIKDVNKYKTVKRFIGAIRKDKEFTILEKIKIEELKLKEKEDEKKEKESKRRIIPPAIPAKVKEALNILECNETSSFEFIKKQYRTLSKRYHPDAITGYGFSDSDILKATEIFKKVNNAYFVLKEYNK